MGSSANPAAPAAAATPVLSQSTLDEIKAAGKAALGAVLPIIGPHLRDELIAYENTHMTGILKGIEKHLVNDVLDDALAAIGESSLAV